MVVLAFSEVIGTNLQSTKNSKGVKFEHTTLKCQLKHLSGNICGTKCTFQHRTGYSNPYIHIVHHHFTDDENLALKAYAEAKGLQESIGGNIMEHLNTTDISTKELAMVDWVKLIVRKNLPLNVCERVDLRSFAKYSSSENIGRHMVRAGTITCGRGHCE
jgi:hypothetical protein